MAKAAAAADNGKKKTGGISVMAVLILTVLGIGAGAMFGLQVPTLISPSPSRPQAAAPLSAEDAPPPNAIVRQLPPITTNLGQPSTTWIRIEASIVLVGDLGPDANIVVTQVSEDVIGYMRTLTIDQIEGPSGFQHLREDLNDRVRVRSEGKISEFIIQSLIIE
jgi:flagellar FliL protein